MPLFYRAVEADDFATSETIVFYTYSYFQDGIGTHPDEQGLTLRMLCYRLFSLRRSTLYCQFLVDSPYVCAICWLNLWNNYPTEVSIMGA